ncbi:Methyltransferase type 11 [Kribbella flavida DSM 17836]|uniref:Methyltransferase type 11 n=1 Tax=Kribbella flavida (strain DSM 17836 / JCM 10339 / NBRC 14399) TaxID=479435 RepID=D2PR40_KRIFD|nr:class I SAM-dependent methyltransferase [Kribbella flavida]ADB32988.1 Methyltransferase type 11 [Kribbella flavida DSM 17836]
MGIDWSAGRYEATGEMLLPVSELVVAMSEPLAGRTVVDVGCGTGNAALLAAARGAVVTGVDPAPRLLEVARQRAADRGLEIDFVTGEAAGIPLPDHSADVVFSVFAVIFAPDPGAAIAELVRVTTQDGTIRLTSWPPEGPLVVINKVVGQFMAEAMGEQPAGANHPKPLGWHDRDELRAAFAPYGFEVEVERRSLTFTAPSPEAFLATSSEHPMAVGASQALSTLPNSAELEAELAARLLAATVELNEDPQAFAYTNDYVVVTARRG